jgi:calcium/calmodulin-dependent protein kinase I
MDPEKFDALMTTCGTPGYMAPEVIKKIGHGKPVDLWSIGVLTFFLLCGYTPFDSNNNVDELNKIMVADFEFDAEYWSEISDAAKGFIRGLIVVDPAGRPTAAAALQHPWVVQNVHGAANLQNRFNAR